VDATEFYFLDVEAEGSVLSVVDTHVGIRLLLPLWVIWLPSMGCQALKESYHALGFNEFELSESRDLLRTYRHFVEVLNVSGIVNHWYWDWQEHCADGASFAVSSSSSSSTT